MAAIEHRFPTATALVQALAGDIRADLSDAIAARGQAALVLSGGQTPRPLLAQLSKESLQWQRVRITLADERWVDASDVSSNEYWLRATLLQDQAVAAQFFGLKRAAATPADAALAVWQSLSVIKRPFDLVLLGMGDDGHTASLFPGSPGLQEALDSSRPPACVAMHAPVVPQARLSLNLSALLDARRIVLHIQGEAKWAVYQQALQRGATADLPVRAVLHQTQTPVEVYWAP